MGNDKARACLFLLIFQVGISYVYFTSEYRSRPMVRYKLDATTIEAMEQETPSVNISPLVTTISPLHGSVNLTTHSREKMILTWNQMFGHNLDEIGNLAIKRNCPSFKCTFIHDKNHIKDANAVIFHMWYSDKWTVPEFRTSNQTYVFLLNESPARRNYHLELYDHFFNLTMTYRLDSDIPFLYGKLYTRDSTLASNSSSWLHDMADLRKKTKGVVWISSHCQTDGKREEYIRDLRKYIPIDMYGRCGNLTCWPPRSSECYNMFRKTYRFVLAFENSVCKDYITEKVYEFLEAGLVPVVYGGGDYAKVLPPRSYINIYDFQSPKELADYLLKLTRNDEEYIKFFDWKRHYSISTSGYEWLQSFCNLCQYLHTHETSQKSYSRKQLEDHWGPQNCDDNFIKSMREKFNW